MSRLVASKFYWRIPAILGVVALAWILRWRAATMLPIDYDEDDYLRSAQEYAAIFRARDWRRLTETNYRPEHPPLAKIGFGLALLTVPEAPLIPDRDSSSPPASALPPEQLRADRAFSALLGTLEAALLALVSPLAGLVLGVHTFTIKYTSQVMLEALPAFTSLLAVLCYTQAKRAQSGNEKSSRRRMSTWMMASGLFLGLTAASKYMYSIVGVAILVDWYRNTPHEPRAILRWAGNAALWCAFALVILLAADPYLWPDPVGRLRDSLLFHSAYSQSLHVQQAGFPAWQPLVWLAMSVPWHPGVFVVSLDALITLLALVGVRRLWKMEPVHVLWLGSGMVFLLLWPTKWPQYILILSAPLSLAAGEGLRALAAHPWALLRGHRTRPKTRTAEPTSLAETLQSIPWLSPGLIGLGLLILFPLFYQLAMAFTDFNGAAIRDGINGGVWRAAWQGLTGQIEAVNWDPFSQVRYSSTTVNFAGPNLLLRVFSGLGADVLVFDIIWTVLSVSLQAALGIGAALMLNRRGVRYVGLWRTVFILPWAIPEFIGALVWRRTFEPDIGWLGMALPEGARAASGLSGTTYSLTVLLIAAAWFGFPFVMLAASASLKLVPQEVYDAAALDGASGFAMFRDVTWPLLLPLMVPTLIIRSILAFNQFYLFYVMRTDFPMLTFANVSYYFMTYGNQYAVSAAVNVFAVAVLILLLVWFNRWAKASEGVTYA